MPSYASSPTRFKMRCLYFVIYFQNFLGSDARIPFLGKDDPPRILHRVRQAFCHRRSSAFRCSAPTIQNPRHGLTPPDYVAECNFFCMFCFQSSDGRPNTPLSCSMMPLVAVVTDDVTGCRTQSAVETNDCVGGCGTVRGWCCEPVEYTYRRAVMTCSNGTIHMSRVSLKLCRMKPNIQSVDCLSEHLFGELISIR
jgi:hypothetical protein